MRITKATFEVISAICPIDGIADLGVLTPAETQAAFSGWPEAVWKSWPDGGLWRFDVAASATADQRAVLINFVPTFDAPPEDVVRRLVPKPLIVDRLHAAGKLDAALAALEAADLYTRQRWETRQAIYSDDPTALALLQAIGADADAILAPEEG